MKVAIVGLGLFGRTLAVHLARAGAEVIALDSSADLVDDIKDEVAVAAVADGTDEKQLRALGVHQVDVLLACIGEQFETNQLVVLLARQLGIPRVLSRTSTPKHARILKLIGADEVILPEVEAAEEIARRLLTPSLQSYFQLIDGYSVAEVIAPTPFLHQTLAELKLKDNYRVQLIAIKRPDPATGEMTINVVPRGTDRILPRDVLAIAGSDEAIRQLTEMTIQ